MSDSTSRRRFLRATGALAAGATAGCAALDRARTRVDRPLATAPDALFRGGLARRGYYPDERVPDAVAVDWRLDGVNTGDHTAAKASAVPTPDNDLVIPGDSGDVLMTSPGGNVRWRRRVTDAPRGFHGTPAVANGVAYLGDYHGVLYALDLETGATRWRTKLGDAIGSSPAYHDGVVYVAVEYRIPDGSVYGVDGATGDVVWESVRPDDQPHSTAALDLDAGKLVVGSNDGSVYAWEYPDMEFAWRFPTGAPVKGPVATYDGGAYVGSWNHRFYRLSLSDGSVDWSFRAGAKVMSGPAVDTDREVVYVGSHDTNLYALDAHTGAERWAYDTGGWLIGCPTTTGERVLVGSYDGTLYALTADGEELWRVANPGFVTSSPRPYDGAVYYTVRASESGAGGAYRVAPQLGCLC